MYKECEKMKDNYQAKKKQSKDLSQELDTIRLLIISFVESYSDNNSEDLTQIKSFFYNPINEYGEIKTEIPNGLIKNIYLKALSKYEKDRKKQIDELNKKIKESSKSHEHVATKTMELNYFDVIKNQSKQAIDNGQKIEASIKSVNGRVDSLIDATKISIQNLRLQLNSYLDYNMDQIYSKFESFATELLTTAKNIKIQIQSDEQKMEIDKESLIKIQGKVSSYKSKLDSLQSSKKEINKEIKNFNSEVKKAKKLIKAYNCQIVELSELIYIKNERKKSSKKFSSDLKKVRKHNETQGKIIEDIIEWYHEIEKEASLKNRGSEINYKDCKIIIRLGNLVEEREEAIVNPANKDLKHDGGAAKAIATAAGEQLNKECKEYISKYQELPTGDAMFTSGGDLFARYVIHAVGPIYNTNKNDQIPRENLRKVMKRILDLFRENNMRSISIPAISTGIFKFPLEQCAIILSNVVKESIDSYPAYFKNKRIVFCNFDEKTTKSFDHFVRLTFESKVSTNAQDEEDKYEKRGSSTGREGEESDEDDDTMSKNVSNSQISEMTENYKNNKLDTSQNSESENNGNENCIKCNNEIEEKMTKTKYKDYPYICYGCYTDKYKNDYGRYENLLERRGLKVSKKGKSTKKKVIKDSDDEKPSTKKSKKPTKQKKPSNDESDY